MMELWNRISYMVQLNAACLMFMLPAQKSQRFYLRFLLGALATIGAAFWINGSLGEDGIAKLSYGYWLGYIMVCVAFVWIYPLRRPYIARSVPALCSMWPTTW